MGKGEIFVNLMNLIGSIDGAVTFMPMVLSAKGLMGYGACGIYRRGNGKADALGRRE